MKRITTTFLIALISLFVFACGGKKNEGTDTENSSAEEQAEAMVEKTLKDAGAYEFLTEDKPCEVLTRAMVKEVMNPQAEVEKNDAYGCIYEWDRPNRAEIDEQMKKAPLKEITKFRPTFTVDLMISKANGATPERFMPKKMSKQQQDAIAEKTVEEANKKLTDKQKKVIGDDAAKDFTKKMLEKVNNAEYVTVEGVGDAAYWSPIGGGNLMVLAGDKVLTLGVFVDEDLDKNIAKAKELAQKILNQ